MHQIVNCFLCGKNLDLGVTIRRQAPLPPTSNEASSSVSNNISSSHSFSPKEVTRVENVQRKVVETETPLLTNQVSALSLSNTVQSNTTVKKIERENQRESTDSTSGKAGFQGNMANDQALKLDGLGNELVEQIRQNTLLSYDKSKVAVSTVLMLLANRIPSISDVVEKIMDEVMGNQVCCCLLKIKQCSSFVKYVSSPKKSDRIHPLHAFKIFEPCLQIFWRFAVFKYARIILHILVLNAAEHSHVIDAFPKCSVSTLPRC